MRVLVATKRMQGQRGNDFSWVDDGELVMFGFECDRDRESGPDGGCGCQRALVGMLAGRGTTTFTVEEKAMTKDAYASSIGDALRADGVIRLVGPLETEEIVKRNAEGLLRIAAAFPVGTVLEKRGNTVLERRLATGN